jgi:hypothetical protein
MSNGPAGGPAAARATRCLLALEAAPQAAPTPPAACLAGLCLVVQAWFEASNRGAIHASLLALYGWGGWLVAAGLMPLSVMVSGIGFTFSLTYATQAGAAVGVVGRFRGPCTPAVSEHGLLDRQLCMADACAALYHHSSCIAQLGEPHIRLSAHPLVDLPSRAL